MTTRRPLITDSQPAERAEDDSERVEAPSDQNQRGVVYVEGLPDWDLVPAQLVRRRRA